MTSKPEKDRVEKILDSLKKAAAGNYSKKLDFASEDDDLGLIADAVNTLLQKTDERLSSVSQRSINLTETVGRLAGGVAHDFNNMLSVILGYADLAKLRLDKQHPVLKDIAEIEKAAIRSRDITTQLLTFSRKQIIEPKIIDLNELVSHAQKALISLIGEDIELKVLQEENLWTIMFDPSQIEQILINLAVNARDAMPGGGNITIETTNAVLDASCCENNIGSTPGQYVRLSFRDNGMGMDKETLQHIFEPFFTTKELGKGRGLGLATVYGIVKQNNGFINAYSETERGTTFNIYLPRASGDEQGMK
jgi:two-component system cell cycle sensor histidine kinase/response regulator CckA